MMMAVLAVLGCVKADNKSADTTLVPAPAAEGSHTVASKLEPDTLVDQNGKFCLVRPHPKFDGISVGDGFENCMWSDTSLAQR